MATLEMKPIAGAFTTACNVPKLTASLTRQRLGLARTEAALGTKTFTQPLLVECTGGSGPRLDAP